MSNIARVRTARPVAPLLLETDPAIVRTVLEDAAHYPGGHAEALARPASIEEIAALLRRGGSVLPVGAQSSLTGGATPDGGTVLSTVRLRELAIDAGARRVRAGAGWTLEELQDALGGRGLFFPPVPTYAGATVGGVVSTNAAGAATFKYGPVRPWVEALTVVLASGDVLDLTRGEVVADADGFVLETSRGRVAVPIRSLSMPDVPKCSAGYYLASGMDLVDLFIGAEGTLGVIAAATLRVAVRQSAPCRALIPVTDEPGAIALAGSLREAARRAWASPAEGGVDVAAIEHLDGRSIAILREDGIDARLDIAIPPGAGVLLLVEIELPPGREDSELWNDLASAREPSAPRSPLATFVRILDAHGVLDDTEVALPGQAARAAAFAALREAVPAGVNRRIARAQATIDAGISKTAADMIVPFARFGEMMREARRLFAERQLDVAVWGHISDGNVHPNVIPHAPGDTDRGLEAIRALGDVVVAMGGCPLAEHGVGRNPVKQALLGALYGPEGLAAMRAVRRALDPDGRLAPGVLFPPA
ncbi:MAG: FAD-binding oxidoreductase [Vicinamibacterales bacterium]